MIRPVVKWIGAIVVVALVAVGAVLLVSGRVRQTFNPDPVVIANASLQSVREQSVLTPFAARYVAVVTATQTRFGLSARKTLIMPGNVRYEIDLAALGQKDLRWDASTGTLSVTLPPVRIAGPEVDMAGLREYDAGGVLMALTDSEAQLDVANRRAAQAELLNQARQPLPMRLARDAARTAVERSFAMPLRAAGLKATVVARFADEPQGENSEQMDRSRSLEEIYANSAAAARN